MQKLSSFERAGAEVDLKENEMWQGNSETFKELRKFVELFSYVVSVTSFSCRPNLKLFDDTILFVFANYPVAANTCYAWRFNRPEKRHYH